eukprot:363109-Chlamydomonas_euryale.AAC.4
MAHSLDPSVQFLRLAVDAATLHGLRAIPCLLCSAIRAGLSGSMHLRSHDHSGAPGQARPHCWQPALPRDCSSPYKAPGWCAQQAQHACKAQQRSVRGPRAQRTRPCSRPRWVGPDVALKACAAISETLAISVSGVAAARRRSGSVRHSRVQQRQLKA